MTEVGLATRDTPDALKKALAEDARRRHGPGDAGAETPAEPAGEEKRGGIFGWLKRG
jgi:molecular chaperone DnaK